jgi:hypothetical protein
LYYKNTIVKTFVQKANFIASKRMSTEAKAFYLNTYAFPAALYDMATCLLTKKSTEQIDCAARKVLLKELRIHSWYDKNIMYGPDGVGLALTEVDTAQ